MCDPKQDGTSGKFRLMLWSGLIPGLLVLALVMYVDARSQRSKALRTSVVDAQLERLHFDARFGTFMFTVRGCTRVFVFDDRQAGTTRLLLPGDRVDFTYVDKSEKEAQATVEMLASPVLGVPVNGDFGRPLNSRGAPSIVSPVN